MKDFLVLDKDYMSCDLNCTIGHLLDPSFEKQDAGFDEESHTLFVKVTHGPLDQVVCSTCLRAGLDTAQGDRHHKGSCHE